jgi:hypothetical protein
MSEVVPIFEDKEVRMTMTVTPGMPPRLRTGTRLTRAPIAADRWRVLDPAGLIIGHIAARSDPGGTRYRARRYHPESRAFVDLGEFWSIGDAVQCLRYMR